MRKIWFVLVIVIGFLFLSGGYILACGDKDGDPCCVDDKNEYYCDGLGLTCVGDDPYPSCEIVGAKKNTCECFDPDTWNFVSGGKNCEAVNNYCDRSGAEGGLQAFCMYGVNKRCLMARTTSSSNCECKTQADASQDPALNGYNRYHTAGTCAIAETRTGTWRWNHSGKWYIVKSRDYCSEVGKEARSYYDKFWQKNYCKCVDKNLPAGTPNNGDRDTTSKLVVDPGTEYRGANEELLEGLNVRMFCQENGKVSLSNPTVNTALGCIPVSMGGFVTWIIPRLMGIIGGISFLIMVYGFIMIATSEGDPKKAQAAKDTITSAITGLILSIFAIFLVRLIMLYVLRLPGVT